MRVGGKTLEYLGFARVVARLSSLSFTPGGRRLCEALPLLSSVEVVTGELGRVQEVRSLLDEGEAPEFAGIGDLETLLERAEKEGVLLPAELNVVADCLSGLTSIRQFLHKHRERLSGSAWLLLRMQDLRAPAARINGAIDRDGRIRDEASAQLRELRRLSSEVHHAVKSRLEEYLRSSEADDVLQERFYTQREDRYVLPVKAGKKGAMEGIVHGVSQSGATHFVEPRFLISHNNRLKLVEEEIHREELAVLRELSLEVGERAGEIRETLAMAEQFDCSCARARLAVEMKAAVPGVGAEPRLRLLAARFPLLLFQGRQVVPNDIETGMWDGPGRRHILVLSGPNAGGKSVALKTCGLCVLMAHHGLLVPAAGDSYIPVLEGLHALPGDLEDVEEQLSTFSGHLQELNRVLSEVGPRHLVLIDEITVGTEPDQGSALGAAFLLELAETGALGMVATHYERLKALAMADTRFHNASMSMDWESLTPTYRLVMGVPGSSRTLEIARRFKVPESVLRRAADILEGRGGGLLEEALARLAKREAELTDQIRRSREATDAAEAAQQRRARALKELARHADRWVARRVAEGVKQVDEALAAVGALVTRLQGEKPDPDQIREARNRLRQTRERLQEQAERLAEQEETPWKGAVARTFAVGGEAWVRRYSRKAQVVALHPEEGTASLQMGPMRLRLPVDELVPLESAQRNGGAGGASVRSDSAGSPQNRLDLRGMTADEGLVLLERALDQAMFAPGVELLVVHGHGTGRMRQAVREYLASTKYPVTYRPGRREEGGDGVTVVELA
jgi:DNA mismatch repair protein MutS2